MASYAITGASRGIGLELTKQLLDLPASQVAKIFALTRSSSAPAALQELIKRNPDRVVHVSASVDDTDSVQKAAGEVKEKLGGQGLDILVNNAGLQTYNPGGTKAMPPHELSENLNVNVIGVHRMIAAFLPLLEMGKQKKVINLSTTMGSIAWAHKYKLAPTPSYKVSKAALNMLNTVYALEYADAGFTFLLVSPGWLKTDLGGQGAELEVDVGVAEVKRIILEATPAQNGQFRNIHIPGQENSWNQYDGGTVPW